MDRGSASVSAMHFWTIRPQSCRACGQRQDGWSFTMGPKGEDLAGTPQMAGRTLTPCAIALMRAACAVKQTGTDARCHASQTMHQRSSGLMMPSNTTASPSTAREHAMHAVGRLHGSSQRLLHAATEAQSSTDPTAGDLAGRNKSVQLRTATSCR